MFETNYFYDLPIDLQEVILEKKKQLEFKDKYKNCISATDKNGKKIINRTYRNYGNGKTEFIDKPIIEWKYHPNWRTEKVN